MVRLNNKEVVEIYKRGRALTRYLGEGRHRYMCECFELMALIRKCMESQNEEDRKLGCELITELDDKVFETYVMVAISERDKMKKMQGKIKEEDKEPARHRKHIASDIFKVIK